ncbi:K(+)-transporting ATPase subunit C [Enterocloster citroniae]|uniref:K(+)-transporting ATPase subunit C n=1 Tax=Enterocloster citroniae TaxID=358743 RepID=UPI00349E89AF
MKSVMKYLNSAFKCSLVLGVLCCVVYPAALTLAGQALFPKQANGSLITVTVDGQEQVVGSEYVGQQFEDSRFFHGRISSVNYNCYTEEEKAEGSYGGVSSGSYNYGNSNPDLKARVEADLAAWMKDHPSVKQEDIPSELLTASGSGLDPHITVQGARVQVGAVMEASGLTEDELNSIIDRNTTGKTLGIFGEETVNVLGCNLDIAEALGMISRE